MRKPELNKRNQSWIAGAAMVAALPWSNLVAGDGSYSGGPAGGVAEQEVIKRLQRIEAARTAEAEGDRLMADEDYEGAISKYNEALLGIPNAPMSAADRSRIISKYANACIKQADKFGKMGRFDQAKQLLRSVLADDVDPDNSTAKTLLKRLDDPDYYNPAMTERHYQDTEEIKKYFKLGLGYFDLGQYDDAEIQFNKVLALDPHNVAARRQLEKTEREIDNYLHAARDHTRQYMLRKVDEQWETAVPRIVTIPNAPGPGGPDKTGAILMKLKSINLPRLQFEQANIDEVIAYLKAKSVEFDPMEPKTGVNFILQGVEKAQPITLDIRDVPLLVALDQIVALANMKYRVESHAVVITSLAGSSDKIESRVYSVPPNFLSLAGAGGAAGGAAPDAAADPFAAGGTGDKPAIASRPDAKSVLVSLGANFDAPNSSATFLPGSSRLIVKNTLQQLDFIESLIEDMRKTTSKQVHITTKFVEVSQRNTDELGFDWLVGAFNVGGNRVFGSGGTVGNSGDLQATDYPFLAPTSGAQPVPIAQNPVTRGLRFGTNAISQNAIDSLIARQLVTSDISTLSPGVFALAGVFTDPQFQTVMRALAQKKGVDLLTAPSIVTRSGQRAKIEIIREFPYPTDFDPPQIPQDFGSISTTGGFLGGGIPGAATPTGSVSSFPVTPTTPTTFEVRNTGVSMEVDPVIGEDGYTIDLNLAPEVVEFEGFINYGSPINTGAVNAAGIPTTVVLTENRIEQPVFATRKLTTAVTIWDGQTVGIGGLIREDVQMVEDKVPLLGDLPLLGRLFRTEAEDHFKRNLMIYVTANLIDPAGQAIHKRGESQPSGSGDGGPTLFPDGASP